jgi:protein-S-isoprenylcysteine O-methyltransferase Ste14
MLRSSDGDTMRANIATLIAALVGVGILGVGFRGGPWTATRIAGVLVCVGALALLSVARIQLGRSFSVQARAMHLVTTGVYARIRNPIYLAGELLFVGLALFVPSWIPLLIVAVTVPIQMVRARREADVLRAAFGEEYEAYRRDTWF